MCFFIKVIISFYFDSYGGNPEKILLQKLPKSKTFHIYKIQLFA